MLTTCARFPICVGTGNISKDKKKLCENSNCVERVWCTIFYFSKLKKAYLFGFGKLTEIHEDIYKHENIHKYLKFSLV